MPEPTTVFFDIGGVLLTKGWDGESRRLACATFGLPEEEYERRHEQVVDEFEKGRLGLEAYLDKTVFYEERPFDREIFRAFMFRRSQPYPESIALAREIAENNRYRMATINNESREINDYRIASFGLRELFSAFFSSAYLGARKPEPLIYERALAITQRRPEECVFVDDNPDNVETARKLGIQAIHFETAPAARKSLIQLGLRL